MHNNILRGEKMVFNNNRNGFENELDIRNELNNRKVKELNIMYRKFIDDLFINIKDEDMITCYCDYRKKKYDIVIKINNEVKRISIKKGVKNSVHVEGISSFIDFLISNSISHNSVINYLEYHYADGTINGRGQNRVSASEYKLTNQSKIDLINEEINQDAILEKAIDRFILRGNLSVKSIDAILFGVKDDFIWIKKEDIKKLILSKKNTYSSAVHFGPLTVQPLDRCLNRNEKYEAKRFSIQVKWYNLVDDIIENMNNKAMEKSGYIEIYNSYKH